MRTLTGLVLLIILGLNFSAQASVIHDPVRIQAVGERPAWNPGQDISFSLLVEAGDTADLSDLGLAGEGWTVKQTDLPAALNLAKGGGREFHATVQAAEGADDLYLKWRQNGRERQRRINLRGDALGNAAPGRHLPVGEPPVAALGRPVEPWDPEALDHPKGDRISFTAQGTVMYLNDAGTLVPAVETTVWIREGYVGFLAVVLTDETGHFQATFPVDEGTVIRAQCFASNAQAEIEENDIWEDTWSFYGPAATVSGSSYNFGTLFTGDTNTNAAFHIADTIRYGHMFYQEHGFDMPHIEVLWPEDGNSYYNGVFEEIHIGDYARWIEKTILHEYGHFWQDNFAASPSPDYCNGNCDDGDWFWDCGHCIWCEEGYTEAYLEGTVEFLGQAGCWWIRDNADGFENINPYGNLEYYTYQEDCGQDPARTEGYFAAVLLDMVDFHNEDDSHTPGYRDELEGRYEEIFTALTTYVPEYGTTPDTPWKVLRTLRNQMPDDKEALWATARNGNYDLDEAAPPVVDSFQSIPEAGVLTADSTIDIYWLRPDDDMSGVGGYSVSWSQGQPVAPDAVDVELFGVEEIHSDPLYPGTWYFNVRPVDRAGNWSETYSYAGPFIIRDAEPVDLIPEYRTGWQWPLVPTTETVGANDVTVSSHLHGGVEDTYWNFALENQGEDASGAYEVGLRIGGINMDVHAMPNLYGGLGTSAINLGPVEVRGGRHMTTLILDAGGDIPESGENNNFWAGQWVWTPEDLPSGTSAVSGPRSPIADLSWFNWNQPLAPSCNGYALDMVPAFHGALLYSEDAIDYDLRLHESVHSAENGFEEVLAESARGIGMLDMVIVNAVNAGYVDHDLGVVNNGEAIGQVYLDAIESEFISSWDSRIEQLVKGHMAHIYTFTSPSSNGGLITATMRTPDSGVAIGLAHLGPDFSMGSVLDADAVVMSEDGETIRLYIEQEPGTLGGVLLWRDDVISLDHDTTVHATVDIRPTRPELAPVASGGWEYPLLPHNTAYSPPNIFLSPPEMLWAESATYLYAGIGNATEQSCDYPVSAVRLDGQLLWEIASEGSTFPGGVLARLRSPQLDIPGGRHTLVMEVDSEEMVAEEDEYNNIQAHQWCWIPVEQPFDGAARALAAIPDARGDFEVLEELEDEYYPPRNCLGVRTADSGGLANPLLVACAQAPVDRLDRLFMKLHTVSDDPHEAFSGSGTQGNTSNVAGGTQLIVLQNGAGDAQYDVGLSASAPVSGGSFQLEGSTTPIGHHGLYTGLSLGAGDLVNVHAFNQTTTWGRRIRLSYDEAAANVGLAVHVFAPATKYWALDEFKAFEEWDIESSGGTREVFVETEPGTIMAVVVWRLDDQGLENSVSYSLSLSGDVSGIGGDGAVPAVTHLGGAAPNPFNPQTTISYELAGAEMVDLTVFDLRGVAVRRLHRGTQAAGRHEVSWNGLDDGGRRVASGPYFVRLRSDTVSEMVKVMLVK